MGVIVQAITGLDSVSWTRQHLLACTKNGLRIQGYVWCFPSGTAASMRGRLAMFDGFAIERLWLDAEQSGLHVADVDRDLVLCDSYTGKPTGVYTGRWFFAQQGWLGLRKWSDRPLWDANYDGTPNVAVGFVPYAGWTAPVIKQYRGTSTIGRVSMVDLDVSA